MNKLIFLLVLIPLIYSLTIEQSFDSWANLHSKEYHSHQDRVQRLSIYKSNLQFIEDHNRKNVGFTVAMNKFGDLTRDEFARLYLSKVINTSDIVQNNVNGYKPIFEMANQVDWRTKGAVSPVKDQGQCGSCWAFSTTGSAEGAWFIKSGKLVSLSEQQLVDCSSSFGNEGCGGGLMDDAFKYIIANKQKGITTELAYKYTAKTGSCKNTALPMGATLTSFKDVVKNSEQALQNVLQSIGPISIAIDASHSSFQFYSSGVYNEQLCSSTLLDHGVLAVGYGNDQKGGDYYIVKNSWGPDWGNSGYIWMSRNKNNQCGIASMASYPIV